MNRGLKEIREPTMWESGGKGDLGTDLVSL